MPAFTTISNALVAVGAKPFATTIQALRDNPLAIAEGDPTAVAAGQTIKDAALDAGSPTAAGITWVGLRTASLAVGAVGSYAFLVFQTSQTAAAGSTHAGSGLRYANAAGVSSGTPSGTWRLMGSTVNTSSQSSTSLFMRIS